MVSCAARFANPARTSDSFGPGLFLRYAGYTTTARRTAMGGRTVQNISLGHVRQNARGLAGALASGVTSVLSEADARALVGLPNTPPAVVGAVVQATDVDGAMSWSPHAAALLPDVLPLPGALMYYNGSRELGSGGVATHAGALTLGGDLTLAGLPTLSNHAATKQYVDNALGSVDLSSRVPYTGATGPVNLGSNSLTAGAASFNGTATFSGSITTGYGTALILGDTVTTLSVSGGAITLKASADLLKFINGSVTAKSDLLIGWSSGLVNASIDAGLARSAAGVVEVNTGAAGVYGSMNAKSYTANAGTITASTPNTITQTWNNAGVNFDLLKATVTPTARGNASTWINFVSTTMDGGNNTPTFKVSFQDGAITACGKWGDGSLLLGGPSVGSTIIPVYGTGLRFSSGSPSNYVFRLGSHGQWGGNSQFENWHTNNSLIFTGTGITGALSWDANDQFSLRRSTNPQAINIHNIYTDLTNREYGQVGWASNQFRIQTIAGSAGGSNRDIVFGCTNAAGTWAAKVTIPIVSTGAFYLGPPADSATTGGNARGAGSIDFQTVRSAAGQVASGTYSFMGTAQNSTIGAGSSFIGTGANNSISSNGSGFIGGGSNNSTGWQNNVIVWGGNSSIATFAAGAFIGFGNYASIGQFSSYTFLGGGSVCTIGQSSSYSAIVGGNSNTIGNSSQYGFIGSGSGNSLGASVEAGVVCGGASNTVTASYGRVLGGAAGKADRYGMEASAHGTFAATGDAQRVSFGPWRNKTTDATPTVLYLDGSAQKLPVPSGKVVTGLLNVTGVKSDGTAVANYMRQVRVKNVAGTTTLVGAADPVGTDVAAGTALSVTGNDTSDVLEITVTGIAAETWRWVAVFEVGCDVGIGA